MSSEPNARGVAAVCDADDPSAPELAGYLAGRGDAATIFRRRKLDDLDRAVRSGRVGEVVFVSPEDLLEAVWDKRVDFEAWRAARVRVSFLRLPQNTDELLQRVLSCWDCWRLRRRRRQIVATVLLGLAALLAAWVLVWAGS
jgi:hypothetical protein